MGALDVLSMDRFQPLSAFASIFSGSAVNRKGEGVRAVMVGDLDGSGFLPVELAEVGEPKAGKSRQLRSGDIVVSLRGSSNACAVVEARDIADTPLFATLDLAVVRLHDPDFSSPHYIATWLNLPATQALLTVHRTGTAALRLPLGPLKDLRVPLPDPDRQRQVVALSRLASEERQLRMRLAKLRAEMNHELLRRAAEANSVMKEPA